MTVEILSGELDAAERAQVAALHHAVLEDSILSSLGRPIVQRYYEYIDRSSSEDLVACALGGRILGAAVVSFEPASLQSRFLQAAPVTVLVACVTRLFQSQRLRQFLLSKVARRSQPDRSSDELPELVQIFVASGKRGSGLGRRLVAGVDQMVKQRGYAAYVVKTEDVKGNPAIRFYQESGFDKTHNKWLDGKNYLCFERKVTWAAYG